MLLALAGNKTMLAIKAVKSGYQGRPTGSPKRLERVRGASAWRVCVSRLKHPGSHRARLAVCGALSAEQRPPRASLTGTQGGFRGAAAETALPQSSAKISSESSRLQADVSITETNAPCPHPSLSLIMSLSFFLLLPLSFCHTSTAAQHQHPAPGAPFISNADRDMPRAPAR